jgi:hypothetical protein
MYVFKGKHPRLSSRTGHYPVQECCELSAPQDDRFKRGHVLLRYRDVQQWRQDGDVFGRFDGARYDGADRSGCLGRQNKGGLPQERAF